ncbi:efflux RND transporter permease subunit [Marinomonas sp. IMCC 4694]|uniref:efflux RND transporter permease subunit n=1 Tax=Marinomonas sp. IMCC 4694 TaxID=2605432 RepID=UPI0011E646CC|nr:efflux RND transporter permease subunit [Marinomonas sp. IMCC 4694]TYL47014.1 efflux RND transporter permease subunit [Marinomonas sp. IMCC 4694]
MLAQFFINRPVFAWVISIAIMLAGLGAILNLPVAQYPDVAPPTISISATYSGASAETVENSVTQILEQQLTGLDGLLYFSSSSSSSGRASINVTFEQGTDADIAQVQIQNKIQQVSSNLPTSVQQSGVSVRKSNSDFLMVAAIYDETDRDSANDISDYLVSSVQDAVSRVDGVGSLQVFGSEYAMRIWLDPLKLASYKLMPSSVSSAVVAQNTQVAAGSLGAYPVEQGQELNVTVTAQSKLQTAEQFRNIILAYDDSGATVRLSDVAKVELGSESYSYIARLNGHPASGMAVMLAPGANALSTSEAVKIVLNDLSNNLPDGYKLSFPVDNTSFIRISIEEVLKTLVEAIALVIVVMFIFLQNWRATLIPAIAVPVVLLGTFGVLEVFGFSINTLTMFGIVLSIGLLVDDAIVVVENVERVMKEEDLSPKEATIKSMKEITSALIGIAVVLSAVFLPMAFFSGSTGVIYRQFSITIVAAMTLSVIVALTLTPALCATFLKANHGQSKGLGGWFNRGFDRVTDRYFGGVSRIIKKPIRWMVSYGIIVAGLGYLMTSLPSGFLPTEDQGRVMVMVSLPEGAGMSRTDKVMRQVESYFLEKEANNVKAVFTISGFNFMGSGQNAGMGFIALKDWSERVGPANSAGAIVGRSYGAFAGIRDARIFSLIPPSIRGLGQSSGFTFQLQASGNTDRATLLEMRDALLQNANASPLLTGVRLGSDSEAPQLHIDIDQEKASALGLSMSDISATLSSAWAGRYINDFIDRGRVKTVYMQGAAQYRASPEDLQHWYVRGSDNTMTPFSAFAKSEWTYGPKSLNRFNGLASYQIQGSGASGVSSGAAMDELQRVTDDMSGGVVGSWSGLSYQERLSSGQTQTLYAISILVVFLCLAALYESWTVPFSVILVIPLGVIGAAAAAHIRGLENDVYFQVALLTTIGLSSKNAILIVEFAEAAYRRGANVWDAAAQAARLRLRPIIMTSMAFMVGTLPLALSSGAGANSRISIGSGIVGGTLTATVLAIFFVPLFFVIVRRIFPKRPEGVAVHKD